MRRQIKDPDSGWSVFWRTVRVMLIGFGMVALGFFGALLTATWILS